MKTTLMPGVKSISHLPQLSHLWKMCPSYGVVVALPAVLNTKPTDDLVYTHEVGNHV